MENKKTNHSPKMGKGGHPPFQKAKDTKGSLIKLIKFLSPFYIFIMVSIILARNRRILMLEEHQLTLIPDLSILKALILRFLQILHV